MHVLGLLFGCLLEYAPRHDDVIDLKEGPVRDAEMAWRARVPFVVYLYRGRPLQCGTILSQCRCSLLRLTDEWNKLE